MAKKRENSENSAQDAQPQRKRWQQKADDTMMCSQKTRYWQNLKENKKKNSKWNWQYWKVLRQKRQNRWKENVPFEQSQAQGNKMSAFERVLARRASKRTFQ